MEPEHRLEVYGRVNGHRGRAKITMTPKQRKRYWKKWFQKNYIAAVLVTPEGLELEGLIDEALRRGRQDREAPWPGTMTAVTMAAEGGWTWC